MCLTSLPPTPLQATRDEARTRVLALQRVLEEVVSTGQEGLNLEQLEKVNAAMATLEVSGGGEGEGEG
jgi:hypothetical protein